MLIRVDVYPFDYKLKEDHSNLTSPVPPLYCCLGTTDSEGRLLTVGRKDAHVNFIDKSVSRSHFEIKLVTSSTLIHNNNTPLEGKADSKPLHPSTPDERKACKDNHMHMCLILKESSKFGTFRVIEGQQEGQVEEEEEVKERPETQQDDETDDDEAPPGAAVVSNNNAGTSYQPPPGYPSLSAATLKLVPNAATTTLEKVEDNYMLLPDLSKNGRIILQCGQYGSTVVLTHVPLALSWSCVDSSTREHVWNHQRLAYIGAHDATSFVESTHLICNERKPNAKQLLAWVSRTTPIATTQFLQELLDRNHPTDAFPDIAKHAPTGTNVAKFWKTVQPSDTLLTDLTLLSVVSDDMEALCRAAGASIIELHTLRTEKQFSSKLSALKKEKVDSKCYFFITMSQPPNKKVEKRLTKLADSKIAVPTNQKLIARSMASQEPLKDLSGKFVVDGETEGETPVAAYESDPAQSEALVGFSADEAEEEEEAEEAPAAAKRPVLEVILEERHSELQDTSTEKSKVDESVEEEEPSAAPEEEEPSAMLDEEPQDRSTASAQPETVKSGAGGWMSTKKRSRDTSKSSVTEEDVVVPDEQPSSSQVVEPLSQRRRLAYSQGQDDDAEEMEQAGSQAQQQQETYQYATKRSKLPKSEDGWLVAAPRGAERKAYRTSDRELREYTEDGVLPPVAPSEKVASLIVDVTNNNKSKQKNQTSSSSRGGKDFKKFRKNRINKVAPEARVLLNVVTPKETTEQRELQEEERRLEEQQRLADSLFGDPGAAPAKKSRRR